MEQTFKLNLKNDNEILCSINGFVSWENENDENPECYFNHVMTGQECVDHWKVLQGWEEQDENENNNWNSLCKAIDEDDTFMEWFEYKDGMHEEKNYYL